MSRVIHLFNICFFLNGLLFLCSLNKAIGQNASSNISGISLLGNTGLICIPNAYLSKDKTLLGGVSYIPKDYSYLYYDYTKEVGEKFFFLNLMFLPFLEVTVRVVRADGIKKEISGIGDRSFALRLNLLKEKGNLPELTLGLSDPVGTGYLNETYFVLGKTFPFVNKFSIKIHAGYGLDWVKIEKHIKNYIDWNFIYSSQGNKSPLSGVFGGVTAQYGKYLTFLAEYDTKKINCGIRMNFFQKLQITTTLLGLKRITGAINYRIRLN